MSAKPKSRLALYAAVAVVLVVVAGVGGYYYYQNSQKNYQNSLQPNVQVTNLAIAKPVQSPSEADVVNDGRVSYSGSFDYNATAVGTYVMTFDNSFSTFSSKTVDITYKTGGSPTSTSLNVPAGSTQQITVQLQAGQVLSGSFSVSGGSGNDVNFSITGETCSESVGFTFDLANSGTASGSATVAFQSDGKSLWTHTDLVASGQQVPESGTATLQDCANHTFTVVVTQQSKA